MIALGLRMPFSARLRDQARVFAMARRFWIDHVGKDYKQREPAIAFFRRWNRRMQEEIPRDRLLVYEVSQGWAPLCEFLGRPVPDEPFPHANTRTELAQRREQLLAG